VSGYQDVVILVDRKRTRSHLMILNTIRFTDAMSFRETRRWPPLEVVSRLREAYRKPVIALTVCWPGELSREEEAKQAGAGFCFWAPIDKQPFIDVVEQCLKQASSLSSS
jgi:hypothetical protein